MQSIMRACCCSLLPIICLLVNFGVTAALADEERAECSARDSPQGRKAKYWLANVRVRARHLAIQQTLHVACLSLGGINSV